MELLSLKYNEDKRVNSIKTCKKTAGNRKKLFIPTSKVNAIRMNIKKEDQGLDFRKSLLRPAQAQAWAVQVGCRIYIVNVP